MNNIYKRLGFIILVFITNVVYGIDNSSALDTILTLEYPLGEFDAIVLGFAPRFNKNFKENTESFLPIVAWEHKFTERLRGELAYKGELIQSLEDDKYRFRHLGCIGLGYEFELGELNNSFINKTPLHKLSVNTFADWEQVIFEHNGDNSLKLSEVHLDLELKYPLKKDKLYAYTRHRIRRCVGCKEDRGLLANMYRGELGLGYKFNNNVQLEVGYSPRYNIIRHEHNTLEHQLSTRLHIKVH